MEVAKQILIEKENNKQSIQKNEQENVSFINARNYYLKSEKRNSKNL